MRTSFLHESRLQYAFVGVTLRLYLLLRRILVLVNRCFPEIVPKDYVP